MSNTGQAWMARRQAQAAAARKRPHKQHELKHPGKGNRSNWRKELRP
jgi:hypothetical protein